MDHKIDYVISFKMKGKFWFKIWEGKGLKKNGESSIKFSSNSIGLMENIFQNKLDTTF